jgi:hypothetical protein
MKLDIAHINPSVVASEVKFTYKLPSQEQNGLDRELKTGANKEVFKRWAEAIDCHYMESIVSAKPMHKRNAGPSVKLLVDEELVLYGVIFSFHGLEFKNDNFPR